MSEETTAQSISKQLWAMANDLRGTMNANGYQTYILGFMFYRYLSEHQEHYLKKNGFFTPKPGQTFNEAYAEAAKRDGLDPYLEAISNAYGYAISPQYTWASIVSKVDNNQIVPEDFQNMFEDFDKNAQLNATTEKDFRGVFADINLNNSRLGENTNTRAKSLAEIVMLVNKFQYKDKNGNDILGDVYEYLISKFASNSGKKAGEFYTPHRVSMVLAKLVTCGLKPSNKPFTVLDPACGSGSLLLTVQEEVPDGQKKGKVLFHGQEINTTTYNLARMNLMMHGVDYQDMTLRNADTLEDDWPDGKDSHGVDHPRSFDAVVENPPYSEHWDNNKKKLKDPRFKDYGALPPKSKADYAFLLHGLYHLKGTGTMAIVLPHGVLFRGSKEAKIRKRLLQKNQIDAIIGLPSKLFYSTGIPTCVLVLKQHRNRRDVLFIDASKGFKKEKRQNVLRMSDIDKIINTYKTRKDVKRYAHDADMKEIQDNDYNLNIPRYVDTFVPEPDINISDVDNQIKDIDKQISQTKSEFDKMKSQLVWTNPKNKGDSHHEE